MGRRKAGSDVGFGSDSFLDIIANIVGILIILIVVAGVRVSQSPVLTTPPELTAEPATVPPPAVEPVATIEPELPEQPSSVFRSIPEWEPVATAGASPPALFAPEPPTEPVHHPEPPRGPSPQLVEAVDSAKAETARLAAHASDQKQALQLAAETRRKLEEETERKAKLWSAQQEVLQKQNQGLQRIETELGDQQTSLKELLVDLHAAEKSEAPVTELPHKLTPVSRLVNGKEVHFRLSANRVSTVPVDELSARLKEQVARQKDWLAKYRSHQGEVGPVDGYRMKYVVERQQLSALEELRNGRGYMRIGISRWEIEPEPDLDTETAREAVLPGSRFIRTLYLTEPGATLTFWVYPDSFGLYRELQKLAHREGFLVAARPIPFGQPIAASRHGSRSAGQ